MGAAVYATAGYPGVYGAGGELEYRWHDRLGLVVGGTVWRLDAACPLAVGVPCGDREWSVGGGVRYRLGGRLGIRPYVAALAGLGRMSDGSTGLLLRGGVGAEWPAAGRVAFRTELQTQGVIAEWAALPSLAFGLRVRR